jgi:competence protein ComEC
MDPPDSLRSPEGDEWGTVKFYKKSGRSHRAEYTMQSLEQEYTRWSLWFPVGLGAGISFYFWLPYEPTTLTIIGSLCGTLFFTVILLKYRQAYFTGILVVSIVLGFAVAKGRTLTVATRMLNEQRRATFTGIVRDVEQFPDKKCLILEPLATPDLPQRLRLNLKQSLALQPGDQVRITADLLPLSDPVSPQGYNFRRAAFFQGIGAVGRTRTITLTLKKPPSGALMLQRWRNQLTQKLRDTLPDQAGAIAAALITGDRSGIRPDVRQSYADAGIAHILAISGLHLSLVAGLCFLAIRRGLCLIPPLAERYAIKKWAAALALIFIALYLIISGFAVPAKRAFVMTGLVMIGIMIDRRSISMRSLALSATGILLIWPETLLTASFQLSFAAVIALIAAYEGGRNTLQRWSWAKSWWQKGFLYFGSILFSTLVATAATTPFTLALFNRFTLQAIIDNLLAIPLTGLWIMPAAIVAVLSLIGGGWPLAFKVLSMGLVLLTEIATRVATLPGAAIQVPTPPSIFLILILPRGALALPLAAALALLGLASLNGCHR